MSTAYDRILLAIIGVTAMYLFLLASARAWL